jgi:hypothetical protein
MLPTGYRLVNVPSVEFSPSVWRNTPSKAKILGCTPDFNAWTGEVNPSPKPPVKTLRTASGHLHIGWIDGNADMSDPVHIQTCKDLVKQFDWYLGAWSVGVDKDSKRRSLYGKAGAMRFKPYGVEYRVLSNFWLENEYRMLAVWNRMQRAIWDMKTGFLPGENNAADTLLIKSIDSSKMSHALKSSYTFPIVSYEK